jgi:LmbE family N-acetylglucosaminyl deacetylase
MKQSSLRSFFQNQYRKLVQQTTFVQQLEMSELQQSAIVFAPHQDDETLGCGGTILRKKAVGADVKVVFMTDGCRSHAGLISEEELRTLRRAEAISACKILGLEEQDVFFLEIEDGTLGDHQALASHKVVQLLQAVQPETVFVPYRQDNHPDHRNTTKSVIHALKTCQMPMVIYEYPVWFWYHWPWVGFSRKLGVLRHILKNTMFAAFGLVILKDFRHGVRVQEVMHLKKSALEQHKTQVTEYRPNVNWVSLMDVADGEWMECLLQNVELFHRYRV